VLEHGIIASSIVLDYSVLGHDNLRQIASFSVLWTILLEKLKSCLKILICCKLVRFFVVSDIQHIESVTCKDCVRTRHNSIINCT